MKRYLVEIVVGIVMVFIFLAVSAWQSSETLTKAEVDRYIGIMEKIFLSRLKIGMNLSLACGIGAKEMMVSLSIC